ncbi:MAG: hypothetical protein HXX16_09320 [Bacteroidales bacterium]|nr:hypothetical protein [Bacteroidales bacterium]
MKSTHRLLIGAILLLLSFATLIACKKDNYCPPIEVKRIETPYKGDLYDIYFIDDSTGFIVGAFDYYGSRKSVMLRTTNGADTWVIDTFNLKNYRVNGITGYGAKLFISTIYQKIVDNPDQLYYSDDSGYRWVQLDGFHSGRPYSFNEMEGILLYNSKILRTSNGGFNWEEVYDAPYMAPISHLQFANPNVGYACGGATHDNTNYGYMLKTTDGGKTWVDLNLHMANITDMFFISELVGYLFTYNKELYKTVDGAQTWVLVNDKISYPYPSCHFNSEMKGCYSTEHGVYYTIDGGITWKECYYNSSITLQRAYFINQTTGFAYGNSGVILKITYRK